MHNWGMVGPMGSLDNGGGWFMGPVVGIILLALWLWILVDCARRDFRNGVEKAIWILALIFTPFIGAVVYLVAIKFNNPAGLLNPDFRGPSPTPTPRPVPMPPEPVVPQTPPTPPAPPAQPTPPTNPPQQNQ